MASLIRTLDTIPEGYEVTLQFVTYNSARSARCVLRKLGPVLVGADQFVGNIKQVGEEPCHKDELLESAIIAALDQLKRG